MRAPAVKLRVSDFEFPVSGFELCLGGTTEAGGSLLPARKGGSLSSFSLLISSLELSDTKVYEP